jgi:hypothetical protein
LKRPLPEPNLDPSYIKDSDETFRDIGLRILYTEVEEIVSSKVNITEGVLLNANTTKMVGVKGKWRM